MTVELNDALVRIWVTGWARTHAYDVEHDGTVHAALRSGDSDEWEYVVHAAEEADVKAAVDAVVDTPGRLLTVIAEPGADALGSASTDGLEQISEEEKLMVVDMSTQDVEDPITPEGFTTSREDYDGWVMFTVHDGEHIAARGRVALVEDVAVLDRVYTHSDYRRQGLGTFVTRALIAIALEDEVENGLLIANEEGQELYEYLGWSLLGDVHVYSVPGAEETRPSHSQFDDLRS